jgi:hypothetical protein
VILRTGCDTLGRAESFIEREYDHRAAMIEVAEGQLVELLDEKAAE